MEVISPLLLYSVGIEYQKIITLIEDAASKFPKNMLVTSDDCAKIHEVMGPSYGELLRLNCPAAAESAVKPAKLMQNGALTYGDLQDIVKEIDGRIRDELKHAHAFSLNHAEALMFNPQAPILGEEVARKFESAGFDIEEAAKCHALGRATGAVFHGFRALEIGIKAIAACFSVRDLDKPEMQNWGKILAAIEGAIKSRWPSEKQRDSGDGELFWDIYTQMVALKVSRNGTMHPAKKYTEQEADRILRIVGDIITCLATRIDQNGEPKIRRRPPTRKATLGKKSGQQHTLSSKHPAN